MNFFTSSPRRRRICNYEVYAIVGTRRNRIFISVELTLNDLTCGEKLKCSYVTHTRALHYNSKKLLGAKIVYTTTIQWLANIRELFPQKKIARKKLNINCTKTSRSPNVTYFLTFLHTRARDYYFPIHRDTGVHAGKGDFFCIATDNFISEQLGWRWCSFLLRIFMLGTA